MEVLVGAVMTSGAITMWVYWRRDFSRKATREINDLLARARIKGKVRLQWRKSRRGSSPLWQLWKTGITDWILAWSFPAGVTTTGLMAARETLGHSLNCSLQFWYEDGCMWMRAGTSTIPQTVHFQDFYDTADPGTLVFGVGHGRTGRITADLADIPHLLVGGLPGSGKSVFLRQMVTGLCMRYSAEYLQLVLIDLKGGMEFQVFKGLPHLMLPVVADTTDLGPGLGAVVEELNSRMDLFSQRGVVGIAEWNRQYPEEALPYIVVVVDEYGEISSLNLELISDSVKGISTKVAHAGFGRIARLGRACGVHLVLCTQRPDSEVVPTQLKAQLAATVAFKVRGESNSQVLLGERNISAARLPPYKGRAVFQWQTDDEEVQAPLIEVGEAAAILDRKGKTDGTRRYLRVDRGAEEEAGREVG